MKTRIVQIGNSRGVRIPKQLLEQAGLNGEVELRAEKNGIIISAPHKARAGWTEAAQAVADAGEDQLMGDGPATSFDEEEWEW